MIKFCSIVSSNTINIVEFAEAVGITAFYSGRGGGGNNEEGGVGKGGKRTFL